MDYKEQYRLIADKWEREAKEMAELAFTASRRKEILAARCAARLCIKAWRRSNAFRGLVEMH